MMKKLLTLASIVLVLNSCSKSDDGPAGCTYTTNNALASSSEVTTLQAYASTNYPAAIQHSSGMFYQITSPGTGTVTAQPCSKITVTYSRYSIPANTVLDNNLTATFTLGGLIAAWQQGVPLIKEGGSIMLLVPPSLAYNDGNYLKFDIKLTTIQ